MRRVIVSGYFNPLHGGHLDMIEAAAKMGDYLLVIVNNDTQAVLKKGKIILDEDNRLRLISALRDVDEALLSVDTSDTSQVNTLMKVRQIYPHDELIFANGGDRSSTADIPETAVCEQCGIQMVFGVGGVSKSDSSTRINQATGAQT